MIKETINRLVEGKPISRTDAFNAVLEIMNGDATPAQIGAFLAALRIRGSKIDNEKVAANTANTPVDGSGMSFGTRRT